jgi:hypothetical protein
MFSQVFLIAFSVLLPFVSGQLMVASVMYNPVGTPTQESHGEWIELRNAGTEPLDIRGYFFTNKDPAESREIPFVNKFAAIPPGGYVLAVRNESVFERNYPGYQVRSLIRMETIYQNRFCVVRWFCTSFSLGSLL